MRCTILHRVCVLCQVYLSCLSELGQPLRFCLAYRLFPPFILELAGIYKDSAEQPFPRLAAVLRGSDQVEPLSAPFSLNVLLLIKDLISYNSLNNEITREKRS